MILFHRHNGIQLHHYSFRTPRTWIPLGISVISIIAFFYTFVIMDRTKQMLEFSNKFKNKPLFRQLVYLNGDFGFIVTTLFRTIYYLFYGPKLVDCLRESRELNQTYHRHVSDRKAITIVLSCIILSYLNLFISYFDIFQKFDWSNEFMKSLFRSITYNFICAMDYFPQHSLLYGEWLIYRSILDHRKHMNRFMSNDKIYIQNLASISERFHSFQSLPLLTFWINNAIELTIIFCISVISQGNHYATNTVWFFVYLFTVSVYNIYIVHLNEKTLNIFDDIITQLRIEKHGVRNFNLVHHSTELISIYELEQYRNCFRLKLFNLTYFNMNGLFTLALAILGLTVFILQTN